MSNRVFCANCLDEHEYTVVLKKPVFEVHGLLVSCLEYEVRCSVCGEEVYVAEVNDANVALRNKAYEEAIKECNCTLSPCPFCGGPAELKKVKHTPDGFDYTPRCKDPSCAGRLTKKFVCKETAIYAWERRAKND